MRQELSTREPHGARLQRQGRGARTRGKGTASGADFVPGRRKPRSGHLRAVRRRMDSRRRVPCGTRRVRRFSVRVAASGNSESGAVASGGSRVRVGVSALERIASRFGAALDNARCAVSDSLLTSFSQARSSAFGAARRPCTAQTGKRRAFSGEHFARRRLHNAERFEQSVLPAAGSAASRPAFEAGDARKRRIAQGSERSRERAAPRVVFPEDGFRRAVRPLFADGRRRNMSGKTCLVCAGRRPAECSAVFCSEQRSAFSASPAAPSGPQPRASPFNRNLKKG